MNKDAKRINTSSRPEIERVKSYIRCSNGSGFDGDGYVFKTAVKEMKEELSKTCKTIKYCSKKCHYKIVEQKNEIFPVTA